MAAEGRLYCGVDLGGTKVAAGLVDARGKLLHEDTIPTEAAAGFDAVLDRIGNLIEGLHGKARAEGRTVHHVGVGAAGQIELGSGIIRFAPNLGWTDAPFKASLERRIGLEVSLDNDVRVATLGEYLYGLESPPSSFYNIYVGTGVGSGFIAGSQLLRGHMNSACEIGHMSVAMDGPRCGCGSIGCLEMFCGGVGIARLAREAVERGEAPSLRSRVEGRLERLDGKVLSQAADEGNAVAAQIIQQSGAYLGIALANVINLFNPEVITLGGGMVALGDLFLESAYKVMKERGLPSAVKATRVATSRLGVEAAILGSASLWRVDRGGRIQDVA